MPIPAPRVQDDAGFTPGTRVLHATFGEGEVVASDGAGTRRKLTVRFPEAGQKVIVARFVERIALG